MSDTPRHDDHEGQPYRDPTAPGDESFSASTPSGEDRGSAGGSEHTEQLPTGDTQQVPSSPAAPPNPYGQPYPTQDELQQRRADDQAAGSAYPPPPPPPGYAAPTGSDQPAYGSAPYGSAPYGSAPAYGAPAYGAPAYGTPAQGSPASLSGSTIALLVVSGLLTLGACGTGIPALVFAIIAVTKKDEAAEAAKWTRWGWIALGVTVAVVVIAVAGLFALALSTGSSSGY